MAAPLVPSSYRAIDHFARGIVVAVGHQHSGGDKEYAHVPMAVAGIVMKFAQIVISIAVGLAAGRISVADCSIGAAIAAQTYRFLGSAPQGEAKNL